MSVPNKKDIASLFGGREKIVEHVGQTISTLCSVREWTAEILARKAFPATAQAAEGKDSSPRAISEFKHIKAVAQLVMTGTAERLPSQRYILAFLDALGASLQTVLATQMSAEDRKIWVESIEQNGIDRGFGSTAEVPSVGERGNFELLLALNALASACEPEPEPLPPEVERMRQTREKVRGILGLASAS